MGMRVTRFTRDQLVQMGIQPLSDQPILQRESAMAHKYLDGLKGIEIGPAAYQPFGLDTISVAPNDQHEKDFYKQIQLVVAHGYVEMDIYAEADALPVEDNSQDFVLSSHVLEHTPNPIACFVEWSRVVKPGGYIYMIVPKREAPYGDEQRMITLLSYFHRAYRENWSLADAFEKTPDKSTQPRHRCHYWVFNLMSLIYLINTCNTTYGLSWKLIEAHETDDKDKQGHMVIYQVNK